MKLRTFLTFTACSFACVALASCSSAQITIADQGKSTFTIVIPAEKLPPVEKAAEELQRDIKLATGADLNIAKDNKPVDGAVISLGNTKQAQSAGFSSDKMADDSFRIVAKDNNLFIFGPDTPYQGWTKNNGISHGTPHGVYTFLEDYLDVRWLMPGDLGRDVPHKSTFTIDNLDRTETPKFAVRNLTHIYDYANAQQFSNNKDWRDYLKLGKSINWSYSHNWWQTLNEGFGAKKSTVPDAAAVKKIQAEHPDWFAMNKSGKRPLPKTLYDKIETTNPELIEWFADQAIKAFKESERPIAFSLSPSDGLGWSQSPESKALYDPPAPLGLRSTIPSQSSLVLKWYDDISRIVAKKAPGRIVTGFLYSDYIYPPKKVSSKLPDNFSPVIAPRDDYGYRLYREDTQKYFAEVMDSWADIVTGPWFYYDLPTLLLKQDKDIVGDTTFPGTTGIVTPAAPDILNIIFPQLIKSHIDGIVSYYGAASWSNAALSNYLVAKMMWDPTADANDLQKEWLQRAYGNDAGAAMGRFYAKLDDWFRDYYQKNEKMRYNLNFEMLRDLYGVHYPEIESLFLDAKKQKMTEVQQQRLQLIEDNLAVLQWRLHNVGYLPKGFTSSLQRNDAQINDLIAANNPDFSNFPGVTTSSSNNREKPKPLPWKVDFSEKNSADKSTFSGLKGGQYLIYAQQKGEVTIDTKEITNNAYFGGYEVKNQQGKTIANGILNIEKPITFMAESGQSYLLTIPPRKPVSFHLHIQNAAIATGQLKGKTLTLSSAKNAPIYVFTPDEISGISQENAAVEIRKSHVAEHSRSYTEKRFRNARTYPLDNWLFSPDPQNNALQRGVTKPDFDDSSWTPINTLSTWQTQGFEDYRGVAWYRTKFSGDLLQSGEIGSIFFGAVDGNTEVYLNGEKIREHLLGPNFQGWNKAFANQVPDQIRSGENILAVKVTSKNDTTASGIFGGVALIAGTVK